MFWTQKSAATMTEMGLLVGLIAILLISSLTSTGSSLKNLFNDVQATLNEAGSGRPVIQISGNETTYVGLSSLSKSFTTKNISSASQIHVGSSSPSILAASAISVSVTNTPTLTIDLSAATAGTTTITLTGSNQLGSTSTSFNLSLDYAQTCLELASAGATTTGTYPIDPDAEGTIQALNVTCVMDSTTLQDAGYALSGWTVLNTNRESLTTDTTCASAGCLDFSVTYLDDDGQTIPETTITAMITNSTDIAQRFYKYCYNSIITKEYGDGTTNQYVSIMKVGGSQKIAMSTATHFDGVPPTCNLNDNVWRSSDIIFINKTDILPIASVWGGDSDDTFEKGQYIVGKLHMR